MNGYRLADYADSLADPYCVDVTSALVNIRDLVRSRARGFDRGRHWLDSILAKTLSERARVINLVRRGLINDAEVEHELTRLQQEVSQIQSEREELSRGQEISRGA